MLAVAAGQRRLQKPCCRLWKLRWRNPRSKRGIMKRICGWTATAAVIGAVLLAGVAGCKSNSAVKQSNEGSAIEKPAAPLDPATLGTITGTIQFAGKPPERV